MNVIILGCGRVGSTLAGSMAASGHDVTIIDRNNDSFRRLGPGFQGRVILGNGIDKAVLQKAGIEHADVFVAVTNGDNTNIMSVQMAKVSFNVPKVIARIYDPIRACAYQSLGVDTICTTVLGARIIEDAVLGKELGMAADYCALTDDELQIQLGFIHFVSEDPVSRGIIREYRE